MNTTRRVTPAILALALVAVGAWFLIARPDQARAVSTGVVERKPLEYRLQIDGQVEATRHATISAPVAGRIAEVLVSDGETVPEGHVLARLDPAPLDAAVAQARAALSAARAQPTGTERLDTARSDAIAAAVAAEAVARDNRDRAELRSPFAGVVSLALIGQATPDGVRPTVEPGVNVPATTTLFTVSATDGHRFRAHLDQADRVPLEQGTVGTLRLDSQPGLTHEVTLSQVVPVPELTASGTRAYPALFDVPATAAVVPGLQGTVTLTVTTEPQLVVPATAILREADTAHVFRLDADRILRRTEVVAGRERADQVGVTGVAEGDVIATDHVDTLRDGTPLP